MNEDEIIKQFEAQVEERHQLLRDVAERSLDKTDKVAADLCNLVETLPINQRAFLAKANAYFNCGRESIPLDLDDVEHLILCLYLLEAVAARHLVVVEALNQAETRLAELAPAVELG
jgi:hypothetical protein